MCASPGSAWLSGIGIQQSEPSAQELNHQNQHMAISATVQPLITFSCSSRNERGSYFDGPFSVWLSTGDRSRIH
jgi:hypothetical protein